ncbi:MAG: flavodoxin [Actinomycetales bacterium]|nr:flavodoxin [Actinomycetales bacterium]
MSTVVVYESMFGNTREIAEAVARGLGAHGTVEVHEVGEVGTLPADLDLLVVGGPTHAFSMSKPTTRADARTKPHEGEIVSTGIGLREWIESLPAPDHRVAVATFDTRVRHPRLPGSAAKAAGKALKAHGYRMIADPETFDVHGMTGPLFPGETDRAAAWGERLASVAHA